MFFARILPKYIVDDKNYKYLNKPNYMNNAKIRIILMLFYLEDFRCFKHYYCYGVCSNRITPNSPLLPV